MKCPLMAPISDTEIAFLRFGHPENIRTIPGEVTPQSPGGVVVYDVVNETITEEASTADFNFICQYSTTCTQSGEGEIAAVVQDEFSNQLVVTFAKGDEKIKVYRYDGTEIDSPEEKLITFNQVRKTY